MDQGSRVTIIRLIVVIIVDRLLLFLQSLRFSSAAVQGSRVTVVRLIVLRIVDRSFLLGSLSFSTTTNQSSRAAVIRLVLIITLVSRTSVMITSRSSIFIIVIVVTTSMLVSFRLSTRFSIDPRTKHHLLAVITFAVVFIMVLLGPSRFFLMV